MPLPSCLPVLPIVELCVANANANEIQKNEDVKHTVHSTYKYTSNRTFGRAVDQGTDDENHIPIIHNRHTVVLIETKTNKEQINKWK